jgi:hypothetical protein
MNIKSGIFIFLLMAAVFIHVSCKKVPLFAYEGATLIITADRIILATGGDKARLTVQGYTAEGEVLHDHTKVVFSTTLGRIEPGEVELIGGIASVEFISGDSSGVAEIRARSGSITAEPDPLEITIGSAALKTLSISASPSHFTAGGGRAHIRAFAFDGTGNLLENIPLLLSTTSGTFETGSAVYYSNDQGMIEDWLNLTMSAVVKVESGDISAEVEILVDEQPTNQLPTASFTYSPLSPKKNETIYFNASSSSDPDPGGYIVAWEWDFGDGKTGSGETTSHRYIWPEPGSKTFAVTLKVTDNNGGTTVTSQTITVSDAQGP